MKLYTYFRSSAAYRVRIALHLKELKYDAIPVHLLRNGGEQLQAQYRSINPSGLVPAFQDDYITLTQSMAILEYLEETKPQPALLPKDPRGRARVRGLALIGVADGHPLVVPRIRSFLEKEFQLSEEKRNQWLAHWTRKSLEAMESHLKNEKETGRYCHGDSVTLADICLVPQVYNARRFKVPLDRFPAIVAVDAALMRLPAFDAARPELQPDAE